MAYSLMLKRSRSNTSRSKMAIGRVGETAEGRVDSKVKVSAQQYYERYMTLARESILLGDRVTAEGYFQHAEHYLRVINEYKAHKVNAEPTEPGSMYDTVEPISAQAPIQQTVKPEITVALDENETALDDKLI